MTESREAVTSVHTGEIEALIQKDSAGRSIFFRHGAQEELWELEREIERLKSFLTVMAVVDSTQLCCCEDMVNMARAALRGDQP